MKCPLCHRDVAVLPDGSLAMHGGPDGGLCRGTNCTVLAEPRLTIGGITIRAVAAWIDPDAELIEPWPGT